MVVVLGIGTIFQYSTKNSGKATLTFIVHGGEREAGLTVS